MAGVGTLVRFVAHLSILPPFANFVSHARIQVAFRASTYNSIPMPRVRLPPPICRSGDHALPFCLGQSDTMPMSALLPFGFISATLSTGQRSWAPTHPPSLATAVRHRSSIVAGSLVILALHQAPKDSTRSSESVCRSRNTLTYVLPKAAQCSAHALELSRGVQAKPESLVSHLSRGLHHRQLNHQVQRPSHYELAHTEAS